MAMRSVGMAPAWRRAWVAILLAVVLGTASAATYSQNDAGSGADAPNTMDLALKLKDFGKYQGNFSPEEGSDWYKVKLSTKNTHAVCVEVGVTSKELTRARVIAVSGGDAREATASVSPVKSARMGIASPGLTGALLRASTSSLPSTGLRGYDFTFTDLDATELAKGDGQSGGDAGHNASTAVAVPRGCFGGTLAPSSNDTVDAYAFSGNLGDKVVVSLADETSSVAMAVVSPTGEVLTKLLSGDVSALTLPLSGTYTLSTSSSTMDAAYVIGMCDPDCEPPSSPCKPMCVDLLSDP